MSSIDSSNSSSQENHGCCQKWYKPNLITLLLWNTLVSSVFIAVLLVPVDRYLTIRTFHSLATLGAYNFLGLVQMLYPIGGLLADLRFGRYKVIFFSIIVIWWGYFLFSIEGIAFAVTENQKSIQNFLNVTFGLFILTSIVGFSGFRSNCVQFSLDQLMDSSSEQTSLFLHMFVWTEFVGYMIAMLGLSPMHCLHSLKFQYAGFSALVLLSLSTLLLLWTFSTRESFHRERVFINPYHSVWKVLKFAVKHNRPLGHRSAFAYADDIKPSRMDFAKRLYGGPFETEAVEDVKTFLRIVLLLLASSPIFFLEVANFYLFPLLGIHLQGSTSQVFFSCTYQWILFESGSMSTIVPVFVIPVYVLLHPYIKKWIPRILVRLGTGIALMVASATSMLVIATYSALQSHTMGRNTCMFLNDTSASEFPVEALVVTNVLYGLAVPLIAITILEFISAQSPHSMKGLLLGVFYAFKGLFITLGSVATFPFAQESLWRDQHGMFDCGFYYYLNNSVFGVFGLVVFILVARWYRNRERDDPPYRYQYAEDYYTHCISQPSRLLDDPLQNSYGAITS